MRGMRLRFSLRHLLWLFVALGGAIASIAAVVEDFNAGLALKPQPVPIEQRHMLQFGIGAIFFVMGVVGLIRACRR